MYCLSFNVLSFLYNRGQTIHSRTNNTLKDRQYIEEDRQYIEEDRQYIGGQTIHWRTDNTLEDRQYLEEDRKYIGGQTIH
jgi:hypothetical protein